MIDEKLWEELEQPQLHPGRSSRRIFPESKHDIHLAVTHPNRQRVLSIRATARAADRVRRLITELKQTEGLSLSCSSITNRTFELQITLTASDLRAVFTPLVEDIARAVKDASAGTVLEVAVRRFAHWQRLMRSIGTEGLGREARVGLFGELLYMRDHLLPVMGSGTTVAAWTGPEGSDQDFQLSRAAIEIKATTRKAFGTLAIASERQLDDVAVDHLVLVGFAVDERRGGLGESLNMLVDDIRSRIGEGDPSAQLDVKLAKIGYFPHHRELYDEPRYSIRTEYIWSVSNQFPRIVESDLPFGVSNCTYDVSIAALEKYRMTPIGMSELIRGFND